MSTAPGGVRFWGYGERYRVRKPLVKAWGVSHGFVVRHPDMRPLIHNGRKPR